MSLILDALRKLERDGTHDPGVLVVGSVPWGQEVRSRRLWWAGAVATLVLVATTYAWWFARARTGPTLPARDVAERPADPDHVTLPATNVPTEAPTSEKPRAGRLSSPLGGTRVETPPAEDAPAPPASRELRAPLPASAPPPATARPELQLNAVSRQDGRPVAVINGRLVREGDSFDGMRVLRIGETDVEVEVAGRRRTLRF